MIKGNFDKTIETCMKCILAATRKNVAIGEGELPADIFILMEAPWRTEDILAYPACGRSGLILRRTLNRNGIIGRHFITNTVLCRPPNNREPTEEEQDKCYTKYLLDLCNPKVILCVGTVAYNFLRRKYKVIEDVNYSSIGDIRIYSIPHPASILYNSQSEMAWKNKVKTVCKMILAFLKK